MKDLQEATERICELKGEATFLRALLISLLRAMPLEQRGQALEEFRQEVEAARAAMLNAPISDIVIAAFETHVRGLWALSILPPEDPGALQS